MKKLSIVTICYNEPGLTKTCESIVNQSFQDFDWIVVDGGSNKETLQIFEKYKFRINKFISQPDNGIYDACNKGINLAESEYIHFLNAGDAYHNKEVLKNVFEENKYNADVLYGEQVEIYKNSKKKSNVTNSPKNLNKQFFINSNIHTAAMFIKTELFKQYGNYNEEYKIVSDKEKWIEFLNNNVKFQYIDIIVADFDKTGISSNKKYAKLHKKEKIQLIDKYFTKEEIKKASNECIKLSFLEKLFSITNALGGYYKVITIFGIHFKLRRRFDA